jgi:hypothetical protein
VSEPIRQNPKDPLPKSGPTNQHELFKAFTAVAHHCPADLVLGAAANLLINAIRQSHPSRASADARISEINARMRGLLLDHYDPVTGKRRSIFPFHQILEVPHFADKDRF